MRSYMNYYNTDAHCEEALANLLDDTFVEKNGWKRVFRKGIGEGILSEDENIVAIFDTEYLPQFHAFAIYDYNPEVWVAEPTHGDDRFVYVLSSEWSIDYEQDARVAVYETEELAKRDMKIEYERFCKEFDNYDECELGDTFAWACISGEWSQNHCAWNISKLKINKSSVFEG